MATLFTATPSAWRFTDPIWTFFYNVPEGDTSRLQMGASYAVVHSPSPFWTEPRWVIRRFQIVWGKWPTEGISHRVIGGRDLTPEEIAHFEGLINQLKEIDDAAPESTQAADTAVQTATDGFEADEMGYEVEGAV